MIYWYCVRVFLAISIPRFEGLEKLMEELEWMAYSKPVRTPELHLTFRFFGEVHPKYVDDLKENFSNAPFKGFSLRIKGIGAFPSIQRANVLFLEVENSSAIEENARLAIQIKPKAKENRPFVPHITVCRFKRPTDCSHLMKKFGTISFEQEIHKIPIYESTLNDTGPVYTEIKSFQLK